MPFSDDDVNSRWQQSTYKLTNYYSLLLLAKYFKASQTDRILFYSVNELSIPKSNFYNKWLNDSFWSEKIPIESLNFLKIDYKSVKTRRDVNNINFYIILQKIIATSLNHFDKPKKYILFVTSDVIIGPNLLSCFSLDLSSNVSTESRKCYKEIHKNTNFPYYSILYSLSVIHNENQFAGILLWKVVDTFSQKNR